MNVAAWNDPVVLVQGAAVLVAAVAAVAVSWQAVLTRRALGDAAASLRIAEESLGIAREAQAHATLMSIETVKARIAPNAPQADIDVDDETMVVLAPSLTPSGHAQAWAEGHVFHIRDKMVPVMVRMGVTLRNTGNRPTRFTLHGALREVVWGTDESGMRTLVGTRPGPREKLLDAGEAMAGFWEVTRTLGEWIEIFEARQSGDPGPESQLDAYVDDGHDTGAGYTFRVLMGGTVVRPSDQGLRETWVITGAFDPQTGTGIGFGRQPADVRYWLSKSKNVPLRDGPVNVVGAVDETL